MIHRYKISIYDETQPKTDEIRRIHNHLERELDKLNPALLKRHADYQREKKKLFSYTHVYSINGETIVVETNGEITENGARFQEIEAGVEFPKYPSAIEDKALRIRGFRRIQ
jgi:hypothetical protein